MNYYQAPAAVMAPEPEAGRLAPHLVMELKRSGFWAGFLGWTTLALTLFILGVFLYNMPSSKSKKSTRSTESTEIQIPETDPFTGSKTSAGDSLFSGVYGTIMIVSMVAAVGMVIMLVWYNVGMAKLIRSRNQAAMLHHIAILQRRLWICIGLYCICSLINTALMFVLSLGLVLSGA
jgi:hypothetical protein